MRRTIDERRGSRWPAAICALLGAAACYGPGGGDGSSASNAGDASAAGGFQPGPATGTSAPVAVPFAHLTSTQYQNTLVDLFAPISVPTPPPPSDVVVEGFDNNAAVQVPSAPLLEAYHTGAVAAAAAAMKDPAKLLGCAPSSRADEDTCARAFLGRFATKAYRRPLESAEVDDLVAFYTSRRSAGDDFPTATTLAIEAVLQSPYFLYRVETGTPIAGRTDTVQLTGYEVASRLSYFLWNSMPDNALFAAASAGELDKPDGVEKHVRRLLTDPRAHAAVIRFHAGWLRFDVMKGLSKDPTAFPTFNADVETAMSQSAEKFVEDVFFGGGTLQTLLTDSNAWVNDALAPIYGVPAPGSATLKRVPVDSTQRAGILTNAGLMAGFAHAATDSPVLRGVFVLGRFMCAPPPNPPPGTPLQPPKVDSTTKKTTRDLFATTHEQGGCAGCHHTIDGIGFGFEHYDAIGRFRTTDNGLPVDPSGWFSGDQPDLTGTFSDAVDLGHKLAASESVQACIASQWMRYALGVDHTGIDLGQLMPIVAESRTKNFALQELVVTLAKSDGFRTRRVGN